MVEPLHEPLAADGALLAPRPPGPPERRLRKQRPGEIGGGVEEQRVVLAEIPHDVVARLVQPIAEAEDRIVDRGPGLGPDRLAIDAPAPQQRHEREVRAIMAVDDRRQARREHRVSLARRPAPIASLASARTAPGSARSATWRSASAARSSIDPGGSAMPARSQISTASTRVSANSPSCSVMAKWRKSDGSVSAVPSTIRVSPRRNLRCSVSFSAEMKSPVTSTRTSKSCEAGSGSSTATSPAP